MVSPHIAPLRQGDHLRLGLLVLIYADDIDMFMHVLAPVVMPGIFSVQGLKIPIIVTCRKSVEKQSEIIITLDIKNYLEHPSLCNQSFGLNDFRQFCVR